jgi:hypothetical protein
MEKGVITNKEFFTKLKEILMEYKSKENANLQSEKNVEK